MLPSDSNEGQTPPTDCELTHVMVPSDSGPPQCTVVPREYSQEELSTRWITAAGGSYVSLDEMR